MNDVNEKIKSMNQKNYKDITENKQKEKSNENKFSDEQYERNLKLFETKNMKHGIVTSEKVSCKSKLYKKTSKQLNEQNYSVGSYQISSNLPKNSAQQHYLNSEKFGKNYNYNELMKNQIVPNAIIFNNNSSFNEFSRTSFDQTNGKVNFLFPNSNTNFSPSNVGTQQNISNSSFNSSNIGNCNPLFSNQRNVSFNSSQSSLIQHSNQMNSYQSKIQVNSLHQPQCYPNYYAQPSSVQQFKV